MKTNVKEIILHQETIEELPKIYFKEVTFSIDPQEDTFEPQTICISDHQPDFELETAKKVRKPVVLFNKDEPKIAITAKNYSVIFEQKKVLPDMALFRWHKGFRHFGGERIFLHT